MDKLDTGGSLSCLNINTKMCQTRGRICAKIGKYLGNVYYGKYMIQSTLSSIGFLIIEIVCLGMWIRWPSGQLLPKTTKSFGHFFHYK